MANEIKLTTEEVEEILQNDGDDRFDIVTDLGWKDKGKYSHNTTVLREKTTGKYYFAECSRSGSYYSDYFYNYDDTLTECEEKEVTIKKWVVKE